MAVTIVVPNALRPFVGGNDRVPLEAATVGEALTKLLERYPSLQGHFAADIATLPPGSGVYRGAQDVRQLQGNDTPLRNDDLLALVVPAGDM